MSFSICNFFFKTQLSGSCEHAKNLNFHLEKGEKQKEVSFQPLWLQINILKIWIINSHKSEDKQKEPYVYYFKNLMIFKPIT